MELKKGRPSDPAGRQEKEIRVYDLLDRLGISFERADHEPACTMEACREIDRALDAVICKNLFLCNRQKTAYYLLMMPGEKSFRTKDLSAQINSSRLSFGDPEAMEAFLDIRPGAVSVLGLMNDTGNRVRLLMDREVAQSEMLGCHPCVNTSSLRMRMKDVLETFLPAVNHEPLFVDLPSGSRERHSEGGGDGENTPHRLSGKKD